MFKEFKSFAMRGNVVDMAVGIIIGVAFGKIVSSLVNDVLMPPIGVIVGGTDFSNLSIVLKEAAAEQAAVVIKYGLFINYLIDFIIIAFVIFLLIKAINRLAKKPETAPEKPTTKECPECLMTIPINARKCGHCTSVLK
ncbi:MAG: large-conductance mechanosensitive channel protein MscL [Bacteroidetes bacterium]|nr:large-conductance mechanosensitive channel protein MscL [Bacteroidota bacterium]